MRHLFTRQINHGWILLALVGCHLALGGTAQAAPYTPSDPEAVVLVRDYPVRNERSDSLSLATALDMAERLYQRSDAANAADYTGFARTMLRPWWQAERPSPRLRYVRAALLQRNHEFESALADLAILTTVPGWRLRALRMQAAIFHAQGEREQAQRACSAMLLEAPLDTTLCLATVSIGTEDPVVARERLESVFAQQGLSGLTVEIETTRAELAAAAGDPVLAEHHLRAALALAPNNRYLLTQLTLLLHQQQAFDQILALLPAPSADLTLECLRVRALISTKDARARDSQKILQVALTQLDSTSEHGASSAPRACYETLIAQRPQQALIHAAQAWQRQPGHMETYWLALVLRELPIDAPARAEWQPRLRAWLPYDERLQHVLGGAP